jgi:hypothetical protein
VTAVPIDFAAVASQYHEQFAAQTHLVRPLFERLAEAVKVQDRRATDAERATRAYPVLRYRSDALCLTVDPGPRPPLPSAPSLGFVGGLRDGGLRFVAELGFAGTSVRQELAAPRLLAPVVAMATAVLASLERHERPTEGLFDPNRARFSDLFGAANLAWTSMLGAENQADLRRAARSVAALRPAGEPSRSAVSGTAAVDPIATIDQMAETFDDLAATVVDAVALLPVLSLGLDLLLRDATVLAKRELLARLVEVEQDVYALRATVVDHVVAVAVFVPLLEPALDALGLWAGINAIVLAAEIPRWTMELVAGLQGFLEGITAWGRWATELVETVRVWCVALLGVDLMPIILSMLFPPWVLRLLPSPPSLTIDDLISLALGVAGTAVRDTLISWLGTASGILYWTPWCRRYSYKLDDLAAIVFVVMTPRPFTMAPDVLPTAPIAGFPDVFDALFGGGRREALLDTIARAGEELRGSTGELLRGAATMAADVATLAGDELDLMGRRGSGLQLQRSGESSVAMADVVFGAERARAGALRRPSALGAAFDDVMAGGGITLAAAVVPLYVGGMRRHWSARSQARPHPTSAHILARHGRLALVRVPRLTVQAPGHDPAVPLAETLGARFHTVVADAYLEGRNRLTQLAKPVGGSRGG